MTAPEISFASEQELITEQDATLDIPAVSVVDSFDGVMDFNMTPVDTSILSQLVPACHF